MDIPQEMIDAFTNGRDQLLAIEGVLGASIGQAEDATGQPTGEVSIRIHVGDVNNPPAGLPSDVGGFAPVLVQRSQIQLDADLARYDPIVGSCSVANVDRPQPDPSGLGKIIGAGTLGAVARDNATGALVGLSNYHVFCQPGFSAGDQIEQPQPSSLGRTPANRLGELLRWSTFTPGPATSPTPTAICDAAICTIERTGSLAVQDMGTIAFMGTARLGELVAMRGKESAQMTEGVVTGLFAAVLSPVNGNTWMLGQLEITPAPIGSMMSQSGDSGSLIINGNSEPVGLFWGEDSNGLRYASDIFSVCADLGISLAWPIPQVLSITPVTGATLGGDVVTITGAGFQLASDVTFGGASCPLFNRVPASDTEILATTPPGNGVVDVLVAAPGGTSGAGRGPTFEFK